LLAVPFTLIADLKWWIIPTVVLVSFTLFGIEGIGAQIGKPALRITKVKWGLGKKKFGSWYYFSLRYTDKQYLLPHTENPFMYSSNDLPLNQFCDQLRKEIEYIIYHIPSETENVLMHGR
jgi:putative membrane protein